MPIEHLHFGRSAHKPSFSLGRAFAVGASMGVTLMACAGFGGIIYSGVCRDFNPAAFAEQGGHTDLDIRRFETQLAICAPRTQRADYHQFGYIMPSAQPSPARQAPLMFADAVKNLIPVPDAPAPTMLADAVPPEEPPVFAAGEVAPEPAASGLIGAAIAGEIPPYLP